MNDKLIWQGVEWKLDSVENDNSVALVPENLSKPEKELLNRLLDAGVLKIIKTEKLK